jgi:hypothetical protein
MDCKPRPNHRRYLEVLRAMTPEQRLSKAFELSQMAKDLFLTGLARRFPQLSDAERKRVFLKRLAKCHNRND